MLQALKSLAPSNNNSVRSVCLGIDTSGESISNNDFRYVTDTMPMKPFFPAAMCKL